MLPSIRSVCYRAVEERVLQQNIHHNHQEQTKATCTLLHPPGNAVHIVELNSEVYNQ